jgi:hypothetical protein
MASKSGHCGKRRFELIVNLATVLWNRGSKSLLGVMDALDLPYGEEMVSWTDHVDKRRIDQAERCRGKEFLRRTKARKIAKSTHEAEMRKEHGIHYYPGKY